MKIRPEHYDILKIAVESVVATHPKAAGLSDRRYRWDLLWMAKIEGNTSSWICRNLYSYLDDTHIDTALRRIVA